MDVLNRTFVGIRIPPQITESIERNTLLLKRKPGVGDVRWNAPSELLINLCQLGELSVEKIQRLRDVLPAACAGFAPMTLTIEGFGGLPNLIQPRFAYTGLTGDTERLTLIEGALWRASETVIGQREGVKPFHAHILLGRLKTESDPLRVALGRALKMVDQPVMGTLQVNEIELLISNASTSGIGYSVVDKLPLNG